MTGRESGRPAIKIGLGTFQPAKGVLMIVIMLWHTIQSFDGYSAFSLLLNPVIDIPKIFSDFFFNYTTISCFFMMCGYSFRRRPLRYLIKGTPLYIMKAYLITSAIIICVNSLKAAIRGQDVIHSLISQVLPYALIILNGEYFGYKLNGIFALWFICVLAFDTILLNQILTLKSRRSQITVCLLLACAGMLLKDIRLPFLIQQTCICLSFMYIGYWMGTEKVLTKKFPWYLLALFFLLNLFFFVRGDNHINVATNSYPNGMVDLIMAWLGGYVFMFGAAFLGQFNGRFFDLLAWMGQNSLILCCVHTVEKRILPLKRAVSFVFHDQQLQFVLLFTLRILLCLALTYAIAEYQKRKRLRA